MFTVVLLIFLNSLFTTTLMPRSHYTGGIPKSVFTLNTHTSNVSVHSTPGQLKNQPRSQGLSSYRLGGKVRDPGNEVVVKRRSHSENASNVSVNITPDNFFFFKFIHLFSHRSILRSHIAQLAEAGRGHFKIK